MLVGAPVAAKLDDATSDKVHTKTIVPDPARKVGEVRLVSRGDAVVVQTLLATKLLTRVIAEIGQKEAHNWPNPAESSASYMAALRDADEKLKQREAAATSTDRRRRLLIEFAASAGEEAVFVGTFGSNGEIGALEVTARELFTTLHPPRDYVLRQIRLILADSFDLNENDVDQLGPLGPASKTAGSAKRPVD